MSDSNKPQIKLFNYYIKQNQEYHQNKSLFHMRTNRWRHSTEESQRPFRFARVTKPIFTAIVVIAFIDLAIGKYRLPAHH